MIPLATAMAPGEIGLRVAAGVALILINAYFVAIEFGLTRLRQYPESEMDSPGLRRAWEMTDDLEFYLTTCQVWISGTSIALGIVAEPGLAALFAPIFENTALASAGAGSLLGFFLINMVHLTHGEQTPTYLGVERSKQVARYGSRPLYWFAWLISPLIKFGDWVAKATLGLFGVEMTGSWTEAEEEVLETRAQLRNRLGSMMEEIELPEERREEVLNALDVGELAVREVLTPADEIVSLSTTASAEENLDRIRDTPHSRFPLVGDDLNDFEGIVYAPSIVSRFDELRDGDLSFADVAAPPMTVSADVSVSNAFDQFQAESQELALVIEDGEVVGLITATDAMEAVMGQLEDPLDAGNVIK
ncbi:MULTISPECIES: CNNM domain-containing protein [Halorubrum]|uniref:IMP dehydrogenase n=1 Tax=Halorubrum sodomense TaxID=35743 RepID=A0A1I6FLQ0_HALSD|nr:MULTISPECIES: hemolysin family protein [Halorubrum]TKX56018.1 HlyC/CorC family transporter [Halorubrum sp. SP3]TKX71035.1 HlyC/CorC family transporter [Halorubrum sp. SP9]SFR30774.1 IMP dehydrogenase [Halorubrum sodomense]